MNAKQLKTWELAAEFDATAQQLIGLAKSEDSQLLRLVSENPNTPNKVLEALVHNKSPYVRYGVSRNVNVTTEILSVLANDTEYDILKKLSENPNMPEKALISIIESNHPRHENLMLFACANIALTTSMIIKLLPNATLNMKRGFAVNPNAPVKMLCDFASGSIVSLRYSIALRDRFPIAVCEILQCESDIDVLKALVENDFVPNSLIESIFDGLSGKVVELLASRQELPKSVRAKILFGDNRYAKVQLMQSITLSSHELDHLVRDTSHFVRIELAKQTDLPVKYLDMLKDDPSRQVVIEVINNDSVSVDILTSLSTHPSSFVRRELALNDHLPRSVSYNLSADNSPHVKIALIHNPNTTLEALTDLVYDCNKDVSRMAGNIIRRENVVQNKYEYMAN